MRYSLFGLYARQFVETRIPELKMLSPNTFYHISEIHEDFKTEGHVHFVFGDGMITLKYIDKVNIIGRV